MSAVLMHNAYGKSRVRLTHVRRSGNRHDVIELSVDIALEGEFEASYLEGDMSKIPADKLIIVPTKVIDKANVDAFAANLKATLGK